MFRVKSAFHEALKQAYKTGGLMIECKICHKTYRAITHAHLFFVHSYTQREYMNDFKVRTIISSETRQILSKINMGNTKNVGTKHTPDVIKKNAKRGKKLWKNPRLRKKIIRGLKRAWKNGSVREKRAEYLKAKWADPVYREKMTEMTRRMQGRLNNRRLQSRMF